MAKKLLLINPVNPRRVGLTVNPSSRFQPLGLGIIAALTPNDWEVEILDENFSPFSYRGSRLGWFDGLHFVGYESLRTLGYLPEAGYTDCVGWDSRFYDA